MADIQTTIKSALSGVGVPVFLGTWQGTEPPAQYITFTTRTGRAVYACDEYTEKEYTVYVEIWSKTSYLTLKDTVIAAMEGIGFNVTDELDVPDPDIGHYSLTFYGVM
jgi:hypothetical protein